MGISRYTHVTYDGKVKDLPKIKISSRETDKFITYNSDKSRLDRIAASIYGDDTYGWLILLANPEYYQEFDIPKNTVIRVPFPLKDAEGEFIKQVVEKKDK